jgi:hypothetical protein
MREESSRTHDVFLSYSTKDKTWADAACAVLERHRIRCWIAPRDITPGDEWAVSIMNGLNGSRMMVLIFSGHANASKEVRREVERASSRGMTILWMRIVDVRPKGAMEYHWATGTGSMPSRLRSSSSWRSSPGRSRRCSTMNPRRRPAASPR